MEQNKKILSMLLYHLPTLLTLFPITFIIKGNANNRRNPPSCPFPVIAFIKEEATDAVIGAIIAPRNPPCCSFISCFTISVAPLVNRPNFSSDSTILIMSSVSSFEIKKVKLFPALTTPFPLIFLSSWQTNLG